MPSVIHLLCQPFCTVPKQALLDRFRSLANIGFGTTLWLVPSQRYIEGLRRSLMNDGGMFSNPRLFTFQQFAEEIIRLNDPSARPLSNVQRRLLAEALVVHLHFLGELSHFHSVIETKGFAETVFEFLGELKRNEIWPEQLAKAVELLESRRPVNLGRLRGKQGVLLYTEYQKILINHNLFDQEGRLWYARDLLTRGQRQPFETVQAVFVDGFSDFTRTQREILCALRGWVEEIWISIPFEEDSDRNELFAKPKATLGQLRDLLPPSKEMEKHHDLLEGKPKILKRKSALPAIDLDKTPEGLGHLRKQLFRPVRKIQKSLNSTGLRIIEGSGLLGEIRLVAREVKGLLCNGVAAEDVLLTAREVLPYADLLREVFDEFGIPLDVEGTDPLIRFPAVAFLLRAIRLPDENWAFGPLTAILRSNYFRPNWPESNGFAEIAQQADALFRLLGEPRGRDAYLNAINLWADKPPLGLEDEQAEASKRFRKHDLASRCRPFLQRFFRTWDQAPTLSTFTSHVSWLRNLTIELGIDRAAAEDAKDTAALARLWNELSQWASLASRIKILEGLIDRRRFYRILSSLTAEAGLGRTPRGPGRVRFLSAPLACCLESPFRFVLGLGERSFPRLENSELFFDELERDFLGQSGLGDLLAVEPMSEEMLLFFQIITGASRQLVLSFPAFDEKGQSLLPSTFLMAVRNCFQPNTIQTEKHQLLIEGFDHLPPMSAAELRIQMGLKIKRKIVEGENPASRMMFGDSLLGRDLLANIHSAAWVAWQRFDTKDFNSYDGKLGIPSAIAELHRLFGAEKVYSPTALEDYIVCPFRFFLGHVLGLEPLEEPLEEIESTKRGAAFHRALSRLHQQLQKAGVHQPGGDVDEQLLEKLDQAVQEYADQASLASAVLWRLEGQRLKRLGKRYGSHWNKFIKPWLAEGVKPQPYLFEVAFGMPTAEGQPTTDPLVIRADGIEVRIRGRIDRVDIAELQNGTGFWIIDYKTGRSGYYTSGDLQKFQRLQLTLYALAVEQILLADLKARPLGLAYWLVSEEGAKVVLPLRGQLTWFNETEEWTKFRVELMSWVAQLVTNIRQGNFPLKPRSKDCTSTCDFSQVCRITQSRHVEKTWELPLP